MLGLKHRFGDNASHATPNQAAAAPQRAFTSPRGAPHVALGIGATVRRVQAAIVAALKWPDQAPPRSSQTVCGPARLQCGADSAMGTLPGHHRRPYRIKRW